MSSSSGYPTQPPYGAAAYPPQQAQMAPNMMMGYPGAMPQYHPQPTNVPMYGNQPGYAAYGAPMPGQSQYPPQYQTMPPVSNPYHTVNSAGYPSQMAAPSQPSPFSPLVMGPAAAPPVPGPALTPSYPGVNSGGGGSVGANGGYNSAAPPSSAASKLFDTPQQAPPPLNNIYSQPPMQQQQQSLPQPSQNMMNMGMFAPVSAPTAGLPPVAPPSATSASSAPSASASSLARPPPVDIIDQDYIAYFSAQYQSHNINFDDAAPPPVIANTLPPRTRMNPGQPGQPLQQQQAYQQYQQYQQQPPYANAQPQPDIFADIPMLAPPPVPSFQPPPDL
eukprot:gene6204-4457_t